MSTPSIYVGTYAKYNAGSITGAWMNLNDFSNAKEFYTAAAELHKDESDPELMFQDWEYIPDEFISECSISQGFWDWMETIDNSHLDAEVFEAASTLDIPAEHVEETYQGRYSSDRDFAEQFADDLGLVDEAASWPMSYIDWDRAAHELMFDYSETNHHYFSNNY